MSLEETLTQNKMTDLIKRVKLSNTYCISISTLPETLIHQWHIKIINCRMKLSQKIPPAPVANIFLMAVSLLSGYSGAKSSMGL